MRRQFSKPPAHLPYIFIIGFNKTATTALHRFFSRNGFPSVHWDGGRLAQRMLRNCIEANQYFRVLDRDYPDSFFILNTRNLNDWINSRSADYVTVHGATNLELELRRLNTDQPQAAVDLWTRERTIFEQDVRRYFRDNPRFLELDINEADVPACISALIDKPLNPTHWQRVKTN